MHIYKNMIRAERRSQIEDAERRFSDEMEEEEEGRGQEP